MPVVSASGNGIKNPNAVEYISVEERNQRIREIYKCKTNLDYFAENYVVIVNLDRGKEIIKLFPKQRELLDFFTKNKRCVVLSSRQSAKTTSFFIYCLWVTCFNNDKTVLLAADKASTAYDILSRIRLAYEYLPDWLKPGIIKYNAGSIEFANGSKITGVATTENSGVGKSANILIIDEAALIPQKKFAAFWQAIYPVISSSKDSQVILVSTPRGVGNFFYEVYESARLQNSKDGWKSFRMDWWDFPGRDEKWKEMQLASMSEEEFAREFGNTFAGSSNTLIKTENIEKFKQFVLSDKWFKPKKVEFKMTTYFWNQWFEPKKDRVYVIGGDVADGIGGDFSTALVFDITKPSVSIDLVASFKSNTISTMEFPYVLAKLGRLYNNAYLAIESNNMGRSIIDALIQTYDYDNILHHGGKRMGVFSHVQTKAAACRWLRALCDFPEIQINLYDKDLVQEIEWFEKKETKRSMHDVYQATGTKHDDLMMAFCWAMLILRIDVADNIYDIQGILRNKFGLELPKALRSFDSSYYNEESTSNQNIDADVAYAKLSNQSEYDVNNNEEEVPMTYFVDDGITTYDDFNSDSWL